MVWTDPVWHYFPPWMLWQNRGMWSRRNSVCSESSPKAFDMSSGITKLPITSWSVDNIYNRVLYCKSISINYNMHGWFLCWYHATGWVWWKSGLRAVAMWSSSSFTKSQWEIHDDVIEWKHFPRYWHCVREIQRSPVNFPHKGQWQGALVFSLFCAWKKRFSKRSRRRGFKMQSRPLWRHCNVSTNVIKFGLAKLPFKFNC